MTKKFEIALLIDKKGRKKNYVAKELGISRQGLYYHITGSDEINSDVEAKIKLILDGNKISEPQIKYGSDGVQKLKDLIIDIQLKHKEELEEKDKKIAELSVAIALANKRGRISISSFRNASRFRNFSTRGY